MKKSKLTRENGITIGLVCSPIEYFNLKGYSDEDIKASAAHTFKLQVKLPKSISLVGAKLIEKSIDVVSCQIVDQDAQHMGIVKWVDETKQRIL